MLTPMTKVHLIGHRRRLADVLTFLHRRRVLHLVDATEDPGVHLPPLRFDQAQVREVETLRYLRARVDAVLGLVSSAPPSDRDGERIGPDDLEQLRTSSTSWARVSNSSSANATNSPTSSRCSRDTCRRCVACCRSCRR